MKNEKLIAKTLYGLEEVLAEEIKGLGGKKINIMNRSVSFEGDKELCYKVNFHSRLAGRVLLNLDSFDTNNKEQLYNAVKRIRWDQYLTTRKTFAVDAVVNHSRAFNNSMFVALVVKDAIVDQFRSKDGQRPSVDTHDPDLRVNIHIHKNKASLSLDSSGSSLNRRGYRTHSGTAPLNENLAAGLIKLSEWDGQSDFVDFMCGSGTIVIEAALIAAKIAPGLLREDFGFQKWLDYDKDLFRKIRNNAKAQINDDLNIKIVGSDFDKAQIQRARNNIRKADLSKYIDLVNLNLSEIKPPSDNGVVVTNPPYGEKMKTDDLISLYRSIGDVLKQNFSGWEAFVISGNLEAAKQIGLKTSRRIKLFNGPIESRLLKFELYQGSRKHKKNPD